MNNEYLIENKLKIFFMNQKLSIFGLWLSLIGLFWLIQSSWENYLLMHLGFFILSIPRFIIIKKFNNKEIKNLYKIEKIYAWFVFFQSIYVCILLWFQMPSELINIVLISFFIAGQSAGALSGLGGSKLSFFSYIIPSLSTWAFLVTKFPDERMYLLSIFILIFMLVLIKSGINQDNYSKKIWQLENKLEDNFNEYFFEDIIRGLSHDINNGLTKIIMPAQIIEMSDNEERHSKQLNQIQNACQDIQNLIKSFRAFSHEENKIDKIKIKSFIQHIDSKILSKSAKQNIALQLIIENKITEKDLLINSNFTILKQSILKLVDNSLEVFQELDIKAPKIELSLKNIENNLIIEFKDNANAISEKDVDKLFKVFYSTKNKAKHKGLGLFLAKKYLKSINNTIEYRNQSFIISIPL